MALRLIELVVKTGGTIDVENVLKDHTFLDYWKYNSKDDKEIVKILVDAENTGSVLNALSDKFNGDGDFRILLLPLQATLPETGSDKKKDLRNTKFNFFSRARHLSIEELFNDIADKSELNIAYLALVFLSTLVAAFGVLKGSNAMIIGAMVIAPLLGPNMALSLGTTLGDFTFIKKSSVTSLAYILVTLSVAVLIGFMLRPDPSTGAIKSYCSSEIGDIILSLAAGAAGALSLTIGLSTMLVGVTVALAVLPSLVTLGLMLGSNHPAYAYGALLLFLTNIICVNFAGVLTFLAQGIRPVKWWQEEKAKKSTVSAIILWALLLAALILLLFTQQFG